MICWDTVGWLSVIGIGSGEGIKIGIHPVIELPVHTKPQPGRNPGSHRCSHLSLRRIGNGKVVAVHIDLAYFQTGVIIIDNGLDIIFPPPVPQRGESIDFKPLANILAKAQFNPVMEGVKTLDHISGIFGIELLVFVRHQGFVFPISCIACQLGTAACPHPSPADFPEDVPFVFNPLGDFIVSTAEPYIAVWKPAVPAPVGIKTVPTGYLPQHSCLHARPSASSCIAENVITEIIISVPTFYNASKD